METLIWITAIAVPCIIGSALLLRKIVLSRLGQSPSDCHEDLASRVQRLEHEVEGIKQTLRGQGT